MLRLGYLPYQVEIIGKGGYSKSQLIEIGYQISNKTENDIYNAGFTPVILGGATLYLNGLPYTEGTAIEMAGNQVLTFTGANGYTKDYLFTLEPSVDIIEVGFNIEVSVTAHLNAKIDNQVVDLTGKYLDQIWNFVFGLMDGVRL